MVGTSWNNSFEVTIVRHGETDYNLSTVVTREEDLPLNTTGNKQAKQIAEALKSVVYDQVYSSNLKRAFETAQTICSNAENQSREIKVDPRLRERDHGSLHEGTLVADHFKAVMKWCMQERKPYIYFNLEGGETHDECRSRVTEFFEELYTATSQNKAQKILIVSHGLWIMTLLDFLLKNNDLYEIDVTGSVDTVNKLLYMGRLQNTSVTKLVFDLGPNAKRRFQLTHFNDSTHLT